MLSCGDQYALSVENVLNCGPYNFTGWTAGYSFEFEKGGMPSDKGTINGLEVLDLKWDGDTLYHKVNGELSNPIHMEVDLLTRHNNTIVQ